jgi:predicted membrane-bound mannosyltransferase
MTSRDDSPDDLSAADDDRTRGEAPTAGLGVGVSGEVDDQALGGSDPSDDEDVGGSEPPGGGDDGGTDEPDSPGPALLQRDRVTAVVVGIALLALALRFFDLGVRVAHWEEARLGWWIDYYARTGADAGPPAIGGSLLVVLGRVSAGVLGTTDLAIRAPVALVGGLLPLAALALRRRLERTEVVTLAGLLALAPLLVYYSRFASVDALAACLALATVTVVVALRDRPRTELVLAAVLLGVLTVGAAPRGAIGHLLALLLAWGIGLVFLPPSSVATRGEPGEAVDSAERPGASTDSADGTAASGNPSPIPQSLVATCRQALPVAVPAGGAVLLVLLDPGLPGALLATLTSPAGLVGVLLGPVAVLLGHLELVLVEVVAVPGTAAAGMDLLGNLVFAAPVVTGLAVVGLLAESWADRPARPIVTVTVAWGAVGIPLQLLLSGAGTPWIATHVVVALTVPAAVGAVATVRWTHRGLAGGDPLTGAAGLLTVLLVLGVLVATLVSGVYLSPTDPGAGPVQYGQPSQELRGPLDALDDRAVADGNPDLVLYGSHFVEPARVGLEPRCARWHNALPLPWYAAASDVEVACASSESELRDHLDSEPTLVVGRAPVLAAIAEDRDDYAATRLRFRAWNANTTVLVSAADR